MASRPIWRGHLRLALVSCPVALYAARHDRGSVRFNMINPSTGNRIRMKTVDSETEEEISRSETIKGYEYSKGRYVTITDEDLDVVRVESSTMMSIEKFVDATSIDPIYYDASYYLALTVRARKMCTRLFARRSPGRVASLSPASSLLSVSAQSLCVRLRVDWQRTRLMSNAI